MTTKELKKVIQDVLKKGWVNDTRSNNRDGGAGNTLEDLLGVAENNLREADFHGYELKSHRELNSSVITLFSKSPTFPDKANTILKDTYGEIRSNSTKKKLYASIFGHEYRKIYGKYDIKISVEDEKEKVYIDFNDNISGHNKFGWTYNELKEASKKLNNLVYLDYEENLGSNTRKFKFNKAKLFLGFNFNKFIDELKKGNIQFDIRIGEYGHNTKNAGRTHDHGSGFRIKPSKLSSIYDSFEEINI